MQTTTTIARFSVVVARPGYATVALGPYSIQTFADLAAWNLRQHLRGEADAYIEVEPYDDALTHLATLPTIPKELADRLAANADSDGLGVHARLAAQVGPDAGPMLAEAYMVRASALWSELAGHAAADQPTP
ncbi:hypothetical protein [Streptomyces mirabilis]|uniref:hypothetical protein n=1 Tax=Streptomyces mirabilis TaxID=68239 RepID=UPI0036A0561D